LEPLTKRKDKTMTKKLHRETAIAFKDKIKAFDKGVQWLYTFEARASLDRIEASLTRLYDNHCLSENDFKRFNDIILNRRAKYVFA
jgi:hypothetical protein